MISFPTGFLCKVGEMGLSETGAAKPNPVRFIFLQQKHYTMNEQGAKPLVLDKLESQRLHPISTSIMSAIYIYIYTHIYIYTGWWFQSL